MSIKNGIVARELYSHAKFEHSQQESKSKTPNEILISKLLDSLETPEIVSEQKLPLPKAKQYYTPQRSLLKDPILTDPRVFTNATNSLILARSPFAQSSNTVSLPSFTQYREQVPVLARNLSQSIVTPETFQYVAVQPQYSHGEPSQLNNPLMLQQAFQRSFMITQVSHQTLPLTNGRHLACAAII